MVAEVVVFSLLLKEMAAVVEDLAIRTRHMLYLHQELKAKVPMEIDQHGPQMESMELAVTAT